MTDRKGVLEAARLLRDGQPGQEVLDVGWEATPPAGQSLHEGPIFNKSQTGVRAGVNGGGGGNELPSTGEHAGELVNDVLISFTDPQTSDPLPSRRRTLNQHLDQIRRLPLATRLGAGNGERHGDAVSVGVIVTGDVPTTGIAVDEESCGSLRDQGLAAQPQGYLADRRTR
ncbi:hypothetical protein ACIQGT_25725 [Streptomyces sp. NPDC093108]|uniref:hypothetical protein n=1 Tax=Streptomyces sp. NPDC093108 TaxID=3366030 RepID=UPI00382187C9